MDRSAFKPLLTFAFLIATGIALTAQPPPAIKTPKATGAPAPANAQAKAAAKAKARAAMRARQIDLNSASKEELKKIPGITDAIADKIIAGRPYLSKAHLVTRQILPLSLYLPIKDQIAVKQKTVTK